MEENLEKIAEALKAEARDIASSVIDKTLSTPAQFNYGTSFATLLAAELRSRGWVDLTPTSTCKVALYEVLLGDGTTEVDITSANLFGSYTEVVRRPQTHTPVDNKNKKRGRR